MQVCAGLPYHGRAADLWAIGICLYSFVYGECPSAPASASAGSETDLAIPSSLAGDVTLMGRPGDLTDMLQWQCVYSLCCCTAAILWGKYWPPVMWDQDSTLTSNAIRRNARAQASSYAASEPPLQTEVAAFSICFRARLMQQLVTEASGEQQGVQIYCNMCLKLHAH